MGYPTIALDQNTSDSSSFSRDHEMGETHDMGGRRRGRSFLY